MTRSIVVGWDGSAESAAALGWALALAEDDGTPLRVVAALEPAARDLSPRADHSHQALRATIAAELLAVRDVQSLAHPAVTITTLLVDDLPADALVRQSRDAAALVLGSRGSGGVVSRLAGSTTLAVGARVECPLVAVPEPQDAHHPAAGGVVVGTDGSAASERAVAFAFGQAGRLHAPLTVVHAWHDPMTVSMLGASIPGAHEPESHTRRQLAELVDWLAPWSSRNPEVEVAARVVHGNPVRSLVDLSRHAQLLVVGCRGRGAVQRAMLGSVSQGVLHLGAVPIAVVPVQR
jgi:nucleotide-binding universal stress UspA family protein